MLLSIDTETTGIDFIHGCRPFLVALLFEDGNYLKYEWDVDPLTREVKPPKKELKELSEILTDSSYQMVFHNALFDVKALLYILDNRIRWDWSRTDDTLLMSHLFYSSEKHGLKDLSLKYLNYLDTDEQLTDKIVNRCRHFAKYYFKWRIAEKGDPHFPGNTRGTWWKMDLWLPRQFYEELQNIEYKYQPTHLTEEEGYCTSKYAQGDVERTLLLYKFYQDNLGEKIDRYNWHKRILPYIHQMEESGMDLKPKSLLRRIGECIKSSHKYELKCKKYFDINIRSVEKLQKVLYTDLKLPILKRTDKGNPSTDMDTLTKLYKESGNKFIKNLLLYRTSVKASEYLSSYNSSSRRVIDNGRQYRVLHPSFNPIGAKRTTRLSSSNPNAQNVGVKSKFNLRGVFGPTPDSVWFSIDFENIEFRIFAYMAGDEQLIKAFEEGKNVHLVFASQLHPEKYSIAGDDFKEQYLDEYKSVKNGDFSLIFGGSKRKVNNTYGIQDAYDTISKQLPKVDGFIQESIQLALKYGVVETLNGYPLRVNKKKPYKACNYRVQGTAGEYIKEAIFRCGSYLDSIQARRYNPKMIATIHDELIFKFPKDFCPEHISEIQNCMTSIGNDWGIPVPIDTSIIYTTWDKKEKYNV